METDELLNELNSGNYEDVQEMMNHSEVNSDGEPPEWFDFNEWFDTIPSPGFHSGKLLVIENADVYDEDDEVIAIGPDDESTWKKPEFK